jgi:two-component system chemotaxis sensor kinase CheA
MLEISPEVVSLPNLVASIERMFAPLARERNLEFHVKTESELPGSMFTDRRRLEQILKNLLSNAFKFTEKGQVTLQISRASSARLALTVIDTGIGVPKGQQEVIFEAFRQADGTTNRKYGGTGLGLSISRDLARLLGGTVEVESEVGVGSRFTLFLPQNYDESQVEVASPKAYSAPAGSSIPLPSRFEPHFVPSISLKTTSGLRQILIVEDDPLQSDAMIRLLESEGVTITAVASGAEALSALSRMDFACMVIDLKLPDMSGQDLLIQMTAQIEKVKLPPVIVYTGCSLTQDEENLLRGYSHSIVIKGACSPERLLDEVGTFLHPAELPAPPIAGLGGQEIHFKGTKILIVDDDVRNIFALSAALEQKGAQIKVARNGKEALVRLKEDASIELVLMDIMMPEMDGYQTTREIRKQTIFAKLPIIALTAKATKRDQDLCMAAGTSDYLAKPINLNHLFSLVRIWAPKSERK